MSEMTPVNSVFIPPNPLFEPLQIVVKKYKQQTIEMANTTKALLMELYRNFLQKHSTVHSLRFSLYIPSFNDGAPCTLTFSGIEVLLQEDHEEFLKISEDIDGNSDEYWNDQDSLRNYLTDYSELEKDLKEFDGILNSMEEGILERIYGSNQRVVVDRKKIEIEEYDCGW